MYVNKLSCGEREQKEALLMEPESRGKAYTDARAGGTRSLPLRPASNTTLQRVAYVRLPLILSFGTFSWNQGISVY